MRPQRHVPGANQPCTCRYNVGSTISVKSVEVRRPPIYIYPLSEIVPNKSLKNLGPVIAALQVPAILQAVVGAHASDPNAARALIRFFQGPAVDQLLNESGIAKRVTDGMLTSPTARNVEDNSHHAGFLSLLGSHTS